MKNLLDVNYVPFSCSQIDEDKFLPDEVSKKKTSSILFLGATRLISIAKDGGKLGGNTTTSWLVGA